MGVDGGSVDAEQASDSGHGFFADQFSGHANLLGGHDRGPAQLLASCSGGVEPFVSSFHDELPDEFGQGGEDVEDQASTRGGGVELFVQGPEPDLAATQVGDDGDQVLQGAAESGQLGDYEGVALEQMIESLGQSGTVGVLAGELVLVDARASASELGELLGKDSALVVTSSSSGRTQRQIHRIGAEHVLGVAVREDRLDSAAACA